MKKFVLDASALIASIYQEKGHDIVDEYLSSAVISVVNLTEVVAYLIKQENNIQEIQGLIKDLNLEIIDFDEVQAFKCAELIKKTSKFGLSLGDRACISLGISKKLPILTADKIWKNLDLEAKIILIR
ncbi:MAG: type II toxin-antitoxin system VapC family toxin [Rickettsiales bacterium]|nr:type II toxin-antitoxin system VapC family toxin [Rickettsiales bacterium]